MNGGNTEESQAWTLNCHMEQADWTDARKTGNVLCLHPSEDAAYTVYKKLCPPWTVKHSSAVRVTWFGMTLGSRVLVDRCQFGIEPFHLSICLHTTKKNKGKPSLKHQPAWADHVAVDQTLRPGHSGWRLAAHCPSAPGAFSISPWSHCVSGSSAASAAPVYALSPKKRCWKVGGDKEERWVHNLRL